MTATGQAGAIAAVGMFDGVHRGHAFLLRTLAEKAAETGLRPLAITFERHPQSILRPDSHPALLGSAEQRKSYIKESFGIATEILDLDADGLKMSAEEFIDMIHIRFGVDALLMGYDNRIGCDRRTGADLAGASIPVFTAPPCPGISVSSSAIRKTVAAGDITAANALLGHPFTIEGKVVSGNHIGTKIGFPTANIEPDEPAQLLPADGVYAVDAIVGNLRMRAMANIGKRPTVNGDTRTFEVHIIDFAGNLYGSGISVEFLSRLRDERRFDSLDDLAAQLAADQSAASKI